MRNLIFCLLLGVVLGVASSTLIAQRSADSYPDAPTADPKHYTVSFENDVARFIRVRYGPGEKSPMHRHLPGCVVYLTDQTMNFTVPDGSSEKETVDAYLQSVVVVYAQMLQQMVEERSTLSQEWRNASTISPVTSLARCRGDSGAGKRRSSQSAR